MLTMVGNARIGRDAELRYTPQNNAVCNLSLAFSYGRRGEDGKRPTQWVEAALWGKQAEALAEYLTRGREVTVALVDCHIEAFQRADGSPGTKLAGTVMQIELGREPGTEQAAAPNPPPARSARAPAPPPSQASAAAGQRQGGTSFNDMDDDIPF